LVIGLLGLLGGSFAAATSIRKLRGTSTLYELPVVLALLKVPSGALTAIVGMIALRGKFAPGLTALDTQEQILAYALIFGYAQLVTRLIDRQAQSVLSGVPSKDPAVTVRRHRCRPIRLNAWNRARRAAPNQCARASRVELPLDALEAYVRAGGQVLLCDEDFNHAHREIHAPRLSQHGSSLAHWRPVARDRAQSSARKLL
jgi:hypothetical protein